MVGYKARMTLGKCFRIKLVMAVVGTLSQRIGRAKEGGIDRSAIIISAKFNLSPSNVLIAVRTLDGPSIVG